MASIRFQVHRVDGSVQEIEGHSAQLARYLAADNMTGKALLDHVVTDDWGAPPSYVIVTTVSDGGMPTSLSIPYR